MPLLPRGLGHLAAVERRHPGYAEPRITRKLANGFRALIGVERRQIELRIEQPILLERLAKLAAL